MTFSGNPDLHVTDRKPREPRERWGGSRCEPTASRSAGTTTIERFAGAGNSGLST